MYPCPACGGMLKFDIVSQNLKCDYCSSLYDPYDIEDQHPAGINEEVVEDKYDVTAFTCPQCGGTIYSTDNTISGFCSFCGVSTVLDSRLVHEKKPMYILPFKKTKEDCKQAYLKKVRKAVFVPKAFKDPSFIDGFRGIYMPYWIYRVKQQTTAHLKGEQSHRSGDYIITDHYDLFANIDNDYDGYSHDAASDFADNISERIAPYDVKELVKFTPTYLSGFYGDASDVSKTLYENDAKNFANDETYRMLSALPQFSGYTISKPGNLNAAFDTKCVSSEACLFPTWFMSYRNKDRVAYATVNGQTGKVTVDLPIDVAKYTIFSVILAAVIFIFLNTFFTFRPVVTMVICGIISIITLILHSIERTHLNEKEAGLNDKGATSAIKSYKRSQRVKKKKTSLSFSLCPAFAIIIYIVVFIVSPVNDVWYYGAVIIGMILEFITITSLIRSHNLLTTRELPAFSHKGGDDRA